MTKGRDAVTAVLYMVIIITPDATWSVAPFVEVSLLVAFVT